MSALPVVCQKMASYTAWGWPNTSRAMQAPVLEWSSFTAFCSSSSSSTPYFAQISSCSGSS